MPDRPHYHPALKPSVLAMLGATAFAASAGTATAGPTIDYGEQSFLTINYELQLWSQYRDYRSAEKGGDSYDTFLRRNRVTFTGQYNDYLGFYAQIEAGNDGKAGNDDKNTFFRDAYLTFDWSDAVRVLAGRFKNTFSRENLEACFEPLTLDRSLLSYTPYGGTRDTGVALWGNLLDAKLQYRLMLADGRDDDASPQDSPRMTARLHYSFLDPEYFYGYRGTYLGTQRVFTVGASYDYQPDVAYANFPGMTDAQDYKAWTADFFYENPFDFGTVTFSGAYMEYDVGGAAQVDTVFRDPGLPILADREGYYVKAGYMFPNRIGMGRLQLFARHDDTEYGQVDGLHDNQVNAAGFNYYFDGQQVKLTVEYAKTSFDEEHDTRRDLQDHQQATVGFQMLF